VLSTYNRCTSSSTFQLLYSVYKNERHVQYCLLLGVRPYACTLCDKTYGRRDYLQRHLKSHNANYAVNLASASGINAAQVLNLIVRSRISKEELKILQVVQAVSSAKLQTTHQDQKPIVMQLHQSSSK